MSVRLLSDRPLSKLKAKLSKMTKDFKKYKTANPKIGGAGGSSQLKDMEESGEIGDREGILNKEKYDEISLEEANHIKHLMDDNGLSF